MSFKAEVTASIGWHWNDGALDNARLEYAERLSEGSGDNQAEAVWHVENQTLLNGTSVTLDLTYLTRTVLGDTNTVTFLKVKALLVVNLSTSGGELLVGGADADEWSEPFGADGDQVIVSRDSVLMLTNRQQGWDVDDNSRILRLAAYDGDVAYSTAIVGTMTNSGSGSSSGA